MAADGSLINTPDEEGYTPLHLGVINGNKEIVKALISSNANLSCMDNEKHSYVHWAAGIVHDFKNQNPTLLLCLTRNL